MKLKKLEDSLIFEDLKNPKFAAKYLEDILATGSVHAFQVALSNLVRVNGGMSKLARSLKRGRESLYKSLSKTGNPEFKCITEVLKMCGLKFSVTTLNTEHKKAA